MSLINDNLSFNERSNKNLPSKLLQEFLYLHVNISAIDIDENIYTHMSIDSLFQHYGKFIMLKKRFDTFHHNMYSSGECYIYRKESIDPLVARMKLCLQQTQIQFQKQINKMKVMLTLMSNVVNYFSSPNEIAETEAESINPKSSNSNLSEKSLLYQQAEYEETFSLFENESEVNHHEKPKNLFKTIGCHEILSFINANTSEEFQFQTSYPSDLESPHNDHETQMNSTSNSMEELLTTINITILSQLNQENLHQKFHHFEKLQIPIDDVDCQKNIITYMMDEISIRFAFELEVYACFLHRMMIDMPQYQFGSIIIETIRQNYRKPLYNGIENFEKQTEDFHYPLLKNQYSWESDDKNLAYTKYCMNLLLNQKLFQLSCSNGDDFKDVLGIDLVSDCLIHFLDFMTMNESSTNKAFSTNEYLECYFRFFTEVVHDLQKELQSNKNKSRQKQMENYFKQISTSLMNLYHHSIHLKINRNNLLKIQKFLNLIDKQIIN